MIVKVILILAAAVLLVCAGAAVYTLLLLNKRPPLTLYESRRNQPDFLPLEQIPPRLVELLIRREDSHFYTHPGYDIECIRDAWRINHHEGRIVRGASTITQQLAKNLYLHFSQTYLRKAVELLIALALEKELGKKRILELYFNIIYFGNGTYGIGEAAHFYFNKSVPDLTLNQMVILISVISAPTAGNPIQHPEVFVSLRDKTVEIFTREDAPFISAAEKEDILSRSASCLDSELRKPDSFTQTFSQTVPLSNERYGPFAPGKREGDVF